MRLGSNSSRSGPGSYLVPGPFSVYGKTGIREYRSNAYVRMLESSARWTSCDLLELPEGLKNAREVQIENIVRNILSGISEDTERVKPDKSKDSFACEPLEDRYRDTIPSSTATEACQEKSGCLLKQP